MVQAINTAAGNRMDAQQIPGAQAQRAAARSSKQPLQMRPPQEWLPLLQPAQQEVAEHPPLTSQELERCITLCSNQCSVAGLHTAGLLILTTLLEVPSRAGWTALLLVHRCTQIQVCCVV